MPRTPRRSTRREFLRDAVTATGALAAAGALPVGAVAQPTALGAQLIGKLEGPELMLDPRQVAQEVRRGADAGGAGEGRASCRRSSSACPRSRWSSSRCSEIGRYGGTWRRGFTGPGDGENGNRIVSSDKLLFWDYTGTKICPASRASWQQSDDGKSVTLYLRQGHEVVGRHAVHRRRLRVLVRGHLPEQGHRADPASGHSPSTASRARS